MKTLLIMSGAQTDQAREAALLNEQRDQTPRWSLFEAALGTRRLDLKALSDAPRHRQLVYRFLPANLCLAYEGFRIRKQYDVVVTWAEQVSLFFALFQRLARRRTPHVAMLYWMSKPTVAPLLRWVGPCISRIVTWSSVQGAYVTSHLGYPADRLDLIKHYVDQLFWRPLPAPPKEADGTDLICSAGAEMRDFPTLIEAMRGLPISCLIAAREIRILRGLRGKTLNPLEVAGDLPANVTVRPHTPTELRALYARARFVVVPLLPSDTDNGITVLLEAMAMGKAVICTRTRGQVDALQDGVSGLYVDGGDSQALRAAILDLWQNPAKAERLGQAARAYIEASDHPLERFVNGVVKAVETAGGGAKPV